MRDWEALSRELARSGKSAALRELAGSEDGRRVGSMLDAGQLQQAAQSGDGEALKKLVSGVLATEEGRRLTQQLRRLMEK